MSWASAFKNQVKQLVALQPEFARPVIVPHVVDWKRLVSLDFETYYDTDYTLKKLSTSEYIRDPRFKAQMLGIKVGRGKTRIVPANKIRAELAKINWSTHAALCHNIQFDAFILSHHYGVHPAFLYDSLSMARGLHSNDIGAGLDEVAIYYGGKGKLSGVLEQTLGVLNWSKTLFNSTAIYCANDVDEMFRIFEAMLPKMPDDEMQLIDMVCRMFTRPLLKVDIPRVEAELVRELTRRDVLMSTILTPSTYYADKTVLKSTVERELLGKERDDLVVKRVIGSNEKFAGLLRAEGIEPPMKISPAWIKKHRDERDDKSKWAYAFAKDDIAFVELPNQIDDWGFDLSQPDQIKLMAAKQARVQSLVDVRVAIKSTTNVTRAERFLTAGANGMALPCGYAYYRAHTGRLGGQNKMNMQNLTRGGELRLSILAPTGHQIAVQDSGQIEARVNAWLWGQEDLLQSFRDADAGTGRDAYCNFGDLIYGREITKADKMERHVGKVCVLGLGYQMGAAKLQLTLAKGALGGPPVYFVFDECKEIIAKYRVKNSYISDGWVKCKQIIEDMASGCEGSYGPLNWEAGTIWLPNGMALKYPDLQKSINSENGWEEWSYQAKAQRKKIYGGLLCLEAKTQVLTNSGWKSIISVRLDDKLWDGANWVSHSGLVYRGTKKTINFGGVDMTPDHEVLVNEQWIAAEATTYHKATLSFARHYRTPDWHADSGQSFWVRRPKNALDSALRLRLYAAYCGFTILKKAHEKLWVFNSPIYCRITDNARNVRTPGLFSVAQHAGPLQIAYTSILGALRRARNQGMRSVEQFCDILGGHAAWVQTRLGFGQMRQLVGLQLGQLPLDNAQGKRSEHPRAADNRYARWDNAALAGSRSIRHWEDNAALPVQPQLASKQNVRQTKLQEVFDLVNAGPLKRFTVRGDDGLPFIVHNCENIVQALARIIVMWQTLQISKKYPVVMSTHDEAAALAKTAQAQRCIEFMAKWMSTPLPWCADIPLNCEGGFSNNYSK